MNKRRNARGEGDNRKRKLRRELIYSHESSIKDGGDLLDYIAKEARGTGKNKKGGKGGNER